MENGFKRINFFKGFFTQAEDWQSAQDYHIGKRQIHRRYLHTPGVVANSLDDLKVTAAEGGVSLFIAPGYAVDGMGRDLYLPKPEKIKLSPQTYRDPITVYVVIRYEEEKVDLRPNEANPEFTDYAFIDESPVVEITTVTPNNVDAVELARIKLSKTAIKIRNAKDAHYPVDNEIDLNYRLTAGAVKGRSRLSDFGVVIKDGDIGVAASRKTAFSIEDTNVLIERVKSEDAHRYYLVSAYPEKPARIIWRIESNWANNAVEYRLFFKNLSTRAVKVSYRVFGLR